MLSFARRILLLSLCLAGCSADEDNEQFQTLDPASTYDAGQTPGGASGGATGGSSSEQTNGANVSTGGANTTGGAANGTGSTGGSTGSSSGATTGMPGSTPGGTGGTAGSSTGAQTGATTGSTGGGSSGGTTGASSGGLTGSASGGATGASSGGTTGANTGGSSSPATDPCKDGSEVFATGLKIREIALYQVVKIPLYAGGTWSTTRPAPVVQNKKALVRVFFDTISGFTSHAVRGVLSVDNGGGVKRINADLKPTGASTDASSGSSFNFNVEAWDIGAATKISVSLLETTCTQTRGTATNARFPQSGLQFLGAEKINKLRVTVVPMIVGGQKPDTSAPQIETMRQSLLAYYPVPAVEITVRAAITSSISVSASGGGWSDVLNTVLRARSNDNPDDDVYYFGIMAPNGSFDSYCRAGCVLGLAPVPSRVSPDQQGGLGVGYLDEHTADTMVHELGHAHGRSHAPCGGVQGADPRFPYSGGGSGVWGWDSRSGALQNPASTKDIMGYCTPAWISDYNYKAIATRSAAVNTAALFYRPSETTWHGLVLYEDGGARWSGVASQRTPGGDVEAATVIDAQGDVIDTVDVIRVPLSHLQDQLLYIPDPREDWAAVVLRERTVWLGDVRDPL